jgi:NTP pyrophosphatase (non-canonical NTP hydrolase)
MSVAKHAALNEHKLSESLWWIFVLADRLDIDMTEAFNKAMDKIGAGLGSAVTG